MPESIIRAVVFVLLAVSTTALSTASLVLKLRQGDKIGSDKMLKGSSVEEAEFYSSPLDHLLAKTIEDKKKKIKLGDHNEVSKLHLAAKDGDLVGTSEKMRKIW